MAHPFQSIVLPGYIIDTQYHDECPPGEFLLPEYGYYDGYYRIVITATKDNMSVLEQVREVFMVRPTGNPEDHGIEKFGEVMVIPISIHQEILHVVTGCKCLDLGQGPTDFDILFFLLSTEVEDDYGSAWLLFKHDKEESFGDFLG